MKNNKRMVLYLAIVTILVILIVIFTQMATRDTDTDFIVGQEMLTQSEDHYLVYFWQEGCYYCELIEDEIETYQESGEALLYTVDMRDERNQFLWYDWDEHHATYDEVIGEADEDEYIYDVDPSIYTDDEDTEWEIIEEDNQVIAVHRTPFFNRDPQTVEDLDIIGTPTLVEVRNGEIYALFIGNEPITDRIAIQ